MGRSVILAIALSVGVAVVVPGAVAHGSWVATATAKVPASKIYDVRITGSVTTEMVGDGRRGLANYRGTATWRQTYVGVRVRFRANYFSEGVRVETVPFQPRGVADVSYDHGSDFCERETGAFKAGATIQLWGRYPLGANPPDNTARFEIRSNWSAPSPADPRKCSARHEFAPVAGRVGDSLVHGQVSGSGSTFSFLVSQGRAGQGFPFDRLIAGKSFSFSLKGTNRNTAATKEQLKLGDVYVTDGSIRVVFTPRSSTVQRTPAMSTANRCTRTYPSWWSTKERACFLVSATAQWTLTENWTRDNTGTACNGSLSTTMRWSIKPAPFWVGDTFPAGYAKTPRLRTRDFLDGPVKATVVRRASGGAYEFGCAPLLTNDCGRKTLEYEGATLTYILPASGKNSRLLMRPRSRTGPAAPFAACGLVAGERIDMSPESWGEFVLFSEPPRPDNGGFGAKEKLLRKRLLSTPVGGTVIFRSNTKDQPYDPDPAKKISRTSTGTLVFKRVS